MKYVLAVAEYSNFTLAAEKSFVTQPTLSMQIQRLEEELDIQIFDRSKKPIQLTAIGRKIVAQAKNIVDESNRMQDVVEQEKGVIGGVFKMAILPTVMPTLLPMFLSTLTKKYPLLKLEIEEQNTQQIIENLKDGHIDMGIVATPLDDPNLVERPLYYEPFTVYLTPNHPLFQKKTLALDDLNIEDLLLLRDGHCFREGVLNLCAVKKRSKTKAFELESGSFETMIKLVDEGLGMTLIPYLHSRDLDAQKQGNIRFFDKPEPAREISVVYPKSELKLHIIEAIRSVILGVVRGAIVFQDVQIISPKTAT